MAKTAGYKLKDISSNATPQNAAPEGEVIRSSRKKPEGKAPKRQLRGGSIFNDITTYNERKYNERLMDEAEKKDCIGRFAVNFVQDGDIIFLDAGTTTYFLSQYLHSFYNLTVITNDVYVANSAVLHPSSSLVLAGGTLRPGHNVVAGVITEDFIRSIKIDKTFLTCDSVDCEWGISTMSIAEAGIKKQLVKRSEQIILLADSSKFYRKSVARVGPISVIHHIITDDALNLETRVRLSQWGVPCSFVTLEAESPAQKDPG